MLQIQPISRTEAEDFIRLHHRHHQPPVSWKFGVACNDGEKVVGVAMVGRPVARFADDGWTLELTRLCTDGTRNAASKLLGAARRATFALGYRRLVTYTIPEEGGASLRAAGYQEIGRTEGRSWNFDCRPRVDKHPISQKTIWEVVA